MPPVNGNVSYDDTHYGALAFYECQNESYVLEEPADGFVVCHLEDNNPRIGVWLPEYFNRASCVLSNANATAVLASKPTFKGWI